MKKNICLCTAIGLISIAISVMALTTDDNLSRFSSANNYDKIAVITEMLDKAYERGILLVPYSTSEDKNDAIIQLLNCVDHLAKKFPGQSIGTGMMVCCDNMSYLDM